MVGYTVHKLQAFKPPEGLGQPSMDRALIARGFQVVQIDFAGTVDEFGNVTDMTATPRLPGDL